MLSSLVNKPNHIPQLQKRVQASHEPIYYRVPGGKPIVTAYYGLFAVGMVGVVYSTYNLVFGKPAEKE